MFVAVNQHIKLLCRRLYGIACLALLCAAALFGTGARAADVTVLMGEDNPGNAEFLFHLRSGLDPRSRIQVVRLVGSMLPADAEPEAANAGVRTRGAAAAADNGPLTLAIGVSAARAALERTGQEPLLLTMLSRLDYESLLLSSPGLRRSDRRVGVVLRDPAMADQLALVNAVLPQKRRIGVIATRESEPLVRELQRAAQGGNPAWEVQVEYAPSASAMAAALRALVPRSDALMVLPDLIGDNQAATLSVLRAGAGAGLPVFGASEGLVRSGGLAAAVSTPNQLAQQARQLGLKLSRGFGVGGPMVETATPVTVRINTTVARGLGLHLPAEGELTERLATAR